MLVTYEMYVPLYNDHQEALEGLRSLRAAIDALLGKLEDAPRLEPVPDSAALDNES